MGKGSRNRELRDADRRASGNQYTKAKKQTPKWLTPVIAIVLVVAMLFGIGAYIVSNNGMIERNRILVKSKTGKYDVNQQMATYIAWYNLYQTGVWYYNLYAQMGSSLSYSAEEMGLSYAMELQHDLRSGISGVKDQLLEYVALCDAAEEAGITLSDEDKASVQSSIDAIWALKKQLGYEAYSKKVFLEDYMAPGMKEKDIRAALEMMVLANKYALEYQTNIEYNLTLDNTGILLNYRDANLNKFYTASYLSYTADTTALVEQLAAATTPEQFKEIVFNDYFDTNYKGIFNKYTTQVTVEEAFNSINGKTDTEESKAWTEAVGKIDGWELKNYAKEGSTLPQSVQDFLFAADRNSFHTKWLEADGKLYLVTVKSVNKTDGVVVSVDAYIKEYAMVEGDSYAGDANFKTALKAYLSYLVLDTEKPEITYKSASDKATALKDSLKAENADVNAILGAIEGLVKVTESEKPASIPTEVVSALKDAKAVGDVLLAHEDKTGVYYVIYIDAVGDNTYYRYATYESDMFIQIATEMETAANKVVPTEKTITADTAAEANTFAGWISELTVSGESKVLPFVRLKHEAKMFPETQSEEKEKADGSIETVDKTVYSAYIITDTMSYDDESTKIHGGYLKLTGSSAQADAEEIMASLAGKNYANLVAAFYSEGATTSYNAGFTTDSINDETVKAWFESADRYAGEIAIIDGKDGNKYVVVFVERLIGWQSDVKTTYVTEQCTNWVSGLKSSYVFDEKKLAKIDTTKTAATTTAAA